VRNDKPFIGVFAPYLQGMLDEKRAMGLKYEESGRLMHKLDELSCGYDCTNGLSKKLVEAFTGKKPNWHQSTQEHMISAAREVAAYLTKHGVPAYMIDRTRITKTRENFKPYIFTHEQMKRIFQEVDAIPRRNGTDTYILYPTIFRIQYGCGLRISETLALKMKDVDLKENLLYVYDSKNHKDRVVPIDDSVAEHCRKYQHAVHPVYQENDFFFMNRRGNGAYRKGTIYHYYREIIFKCGISHGGRMYGGPMLHSLRHTFCVHSLSRMLKNGISHQVALPLISAYVGHSSFASTAGYLRLTAEAFPELSEQIERAYQDILPELEVKCYYEETD